MPIPVQQFPILTPGQMNPFHQALQSGMENYQNNMKTAYMPYAMQAEINAKQAYANNYGRQMASQVLSTPGALDRMNPQQINGLLDMMTRTTSGSQRPLVGLPGESGGPGFFSGLRSLFGGGQAEQQQGGQPGQQPAMNNNGDNSGMAFNSDGTNQTATNAEINQAGRQGPSAGEYMNQNAGRAVSGNVMTGGGKGTGAGTSYTDPQSQEQYSSPTPATAGAVQTSLITSERVAPYVKNLANTYEDSFGLLNNTKSVLEGIGSYLSGGAVKTPHLSSGAQYQTNLVNAADGFLKELNLNNTTGNRESMERALQHSPGEAPDNYRGRINWLWNTIQERDEIGKKILAQGIMLNPAAMHSEQGRQQLENMAAVADGLDNKPKKVADPVGSWPRNKEAINEREVEGRAAGHGMIWMISPDGEKEAVRTDRVAEAKKHLFREVN